MAVMPVIPSDEWTVADLGDLPDDGRRYELLDGVLLVTPAPVYQHQWVVFTLAKLLDSARPSGLEVYLAPAAWQPDDRTSLEPDVLVVQASDVAGAAVLKKLPLLAVEVFSPSTRRKDAVFKRSRYEEAGIPSYWMVDPDVDHPGILVCELRNGRYAEVGTARGDDELEVALPFPVTVRPSALARH